jgi:hypothetical protein
MTKYSYEPSTPRLAFFTAAAALTAISMSVFVIIPAFVAAEASEPVDVATTVVSRPAVDLLAMHESAATPCSAPSAKAAD